MDPTAFRCGPTVMAGRLRGRDNGVSITWPNLRLNGHAARSWCLYRLDIQAGDYLEFGNIGAYSISGRTDYNGFYSDRIVTITSLTESPPSV